MPDGVLSSESEMAVRGKAYAHRYFMIITYLNAHVRIPKYTRWWGTLSPLYFSSELGATIGSVSDGESPSPTVPSCEVILGHGAALPCSNGPQFTLLFVDNLHWWMGFPTVDTRLRRACLSTSGEATYRGRRVRQYIYSCHALIP